MRFLSAVWASCALCAPSMAQDVTRDLVETRLPGIEVYGDRAEGEPGAISILSIDDIEALRADHPAEVLNTLPGVNIQMNSGQEHLIAIRSPVLTSGAGQGSFLILENGVPTRAPAFGNVNSLFELHHETAGAIEVVRGPGSAKYGSNAVHGLINVIAPDTSGENSYSSVLSASTLQRYRGDWTLTGDFSGAETFAALSVQDDLGWRDNTGVDQQKATFRAAFDLGGWDAVAGLTATNLNQETGGFIEGPDAYEDEDIATSNPNPEAFRDAWSARANLRLSRDVGAGRLTLTPYALTQRMIFLQHFLPNQSLEKNGHDSAGLLSRYKVAAGGVDWTFGVDAGWADGFVKETQDQPFGFFPGDSRFPVGVHYDYDVEVLTAALYAEADWKINEAWRVLAGLRGEAHEYSYETEIPPGIFGRFQVSPDRDDDFGFVSPKLGVVYSGFDAAELYANYARGARAPQASDLYRIQSQQIPGDADVETLDSLEIGVRGQAFGPLRYDIAVYAMKKEDFFFRDADRLNVTDGETEHFGVEAALSAEYESGFQWTASVAYADQTYAFDRVVGNASEVITDGNQIDTAPEWLGDLSFGWVGERASLFADVDYIGEYFTNAANTADYPGHTLLHLRGAYDVMEGVEAFLTVRNVFDENYADRADFAFGNERYFPGEPLNATFGVRVSR